MAERFTWRNFRTGLWSMWFAIIGGLLIFIASFTVVMISGSTEGSLRFLIMFGGYVVLVILTMINHGYSSRKASTKVK